MKKILSKMMNYLQFIKENNILVAIYYINKSKKLFDLRDIAPRSLYNEWKRIANDFDMGYITSKEMYQQSLNYARRYKLA